MKRLITVCALFGFLACATSGTALAMPVEIYSENGPQDDLTIDGWGHELGNQSPFPDKEYITSAWENTSQTACFDDDSDNPDIDNVEVTITNMTEIYWKDLHYVADPETFLTNFDGYIGALDITDVEEAFVIDWVGINRPLIGESMTVDTIFERAGRKLEIYHPGL